MFDTTSALLAVEALPAEDRGAAWLRIAGIDQQDPTHRLTQEDLNLIALNVSQGRSGSRALNVCPDIHGL